ncbi:helix-turn-helix domain-containing protein [Phaeovulum vinaykumarii]|uniref:DNA-binding transcriptional regulator, XRE-family HTH domain n=1 Tax=Phaeovulum vinaykumarii TaxID=407234 RepID=A0A1N7JLK8_9RHOB|nr:helix-turn-helix domain-containing protein [Phaeovulum vinaykumarii]SIS50243.1 DNA-binding transcriptional regulator, XRE-family HTH domain [Phaeovulum vinaykumarii]SOB90170.1 DNA-binding XRE family transcriptional regulator [Phaeovulum vinaykumarii]
MPSNRALRAEDALPVSLRAGHDVRCARTDAAPDFWIHAAALAAGAGPIEAWRRACGHCQRELAAAAGLALERYLLIERGAVEPTPHEVRAIAAALGVPVGDCVPAAPRARVPA